MDYKWVIIVLVIWSTPWKGMALWKSARRSHIGWFIVLLVVNTLAILDILYIFIFSEWGAKQKEENDQQQPPTSPLPPSPGNRPMIV